MDKKGKRMAVGGRIVILFLWIFIRNGETAERLCLFAQNCSYSLTDTPSATILVSTHKI